MDELERLVVTGKELDRKLVADILAPFVRIDKDTCSIRPMREWNKLDTTQKTLVYLLARKAMLALDLPIEREAAGPAEIAKATGIKEGTVAPLVRSLLDQRLLDQTRERKYFVPGYAIEEIRSLVEGAGGREQNE